MIPFSKIFHKIAQNALASVRYNYGFNYLLGAALTYLIILVGFDWTWYQFALAHPWVPRFGFVSVIAGMFVPIFFPAALYLWSGYKKNISQQITALAIGQAAILGLAISSLIKIFTGRMPPEHFVSALKYSGSFQFGFYRGGAFDGWPSCHTSVAFAIAGCLTVLYPENKTVKICALLFAFAIGLGVSTNIHWFSDFVAGAFIGYAVGKAVGSSFKQLLADSESQNVAGTVLVGD